MDSEYGNDIDTNTEMPIICIHVPADNQPRIQPRSNLNEVKPDGHLFNRCKSFNKLFEPKVPRKSIFQEIPTSISFSEPKSNIQSKNKPTEGDNNVCEELFHEYLTWVAVYGIRQGQEGEINDLFKKCGEISKFYYIPESNFILVKFSSKKEANDALKFHGYLLDDYSIIGVLSAPCIQIPRHVLKRATQIIPDFSNDDDDLSRFRRISGIRKSKEKNKGYAEKVYNLFKRFIKQTK